MAKSHHIILPSYYKANNDFIALWRGLETQINLFYVLLYSELTPCAFRRDSDNAIIIFRVARV